METSRKFEVVSVRTDAMRCAVPRMAAEGDDARDGTSIARLANTQERNAEPNDLSQSPADERAKRRQYTPADEGKKYPARSATRRQRPNVQNDELQMRNREEVENSRAAVK
jgi:hypothetical protein